MRYISTAALLALTFMVGCAGAKKHDFTPSSAICVLRGTQGNERVSGVVSFTQQDGYVLVQARIVGLTPGDHGFHVHQLGDITGLDGTTTGGHFNPAGHDHGSPDAGKRHVGDLGNINADAEGRALYRREDRVLSLDMRDPACVIGRAIIVHADTDDMTSQPTGAAGARIASGVIGIGPE